MSIPWIYLLLAAFAEAAYGICVYYSRGFTAPWPTFWAVVMGVATTVFLGWSLKTLPLGLAFAIWGGLAAILTVGYGMIALGEPHDAQRLCFIAFILVGIVGLKFSSTF